MLRHITATVTVLLIIDIAFAQDPIQLDESCIVTVGNQTVFVRPDGSFLIQNISVFQSRTTGIAPQLYRVRATCVSGGQTITGQSEFFELTPGETTFIADVFPSALDPIPVRVTVSAPAGSLGPGASLQLTVVATLPDDSTEDVTPRSAGTTYLSTNPAVLTVTEDGFVTSVYAGTFQATGTIAALNEGNITTVNITAVPPANDFDNDGMPNDYEDLFGLNKFVNDANLDLDNDGLTNITEFNLGTIPNNPDTDVDGVNDGVDCDPLVPENAAPTVQIISPADGATLIEGETIQFSVNANDDSVLVSVELSTDTGFSQLFPNPGCNASIQVSFTVPTGPSQIVFTATATDSVPNVAAPSVIVNVIPDPLTTVIGVVLDPDDNPVDGAALSTNGDVTGFSLTDGSFSIPDVPTILGDIVVAAAADVGGRSLTGRSDAIAPVPFGTTDVGVIPLGLPRAIVAIRSRGAVDVVDVDTLSVTSTLSLGSDVIDVAVSADGATAVVTRFSPRRLHFVDLLTNPPTDTGSVAIPFFAEDVDVACTSTGFALITDGGSIRQIASIDVANRVLVNSLVLPVTAQSVDVTPDGSLALVGAFSNNVVRLIDVSPQGVLTDTGVSVGVGGSGPINVTVSPDGTRALTANFFSGNVGVLEINAGTVTLLDAISVGSSPQSIAFAPSGDRAYVFRASAGVVQVLDIDPNGNVTNPGIAIPVGSALSYFGVDQIAVTADGANVLVHSNFQVTVIDANSNTIIGTIPLANDFLAGGIAVIP